MSMGHPQSPAWSENTPELHKRQMNAGESFMGHSKHTYRQVPPHPPHMAIQQNHFHQGVPGSHPFQVAPPTTRPPFFPLGAMSTMGNVGTMGGPGLNYGPVYPGPGPGPGPAPDSPFGYYSHPNWSMQGPAPAFPPAGYISGQPSYAHRPSFVNPFAGFASSPPPLSPPHIHLGMPYGYPITNHHAGGPMFPPTPPYVNHIGENQMVPVHHAPQVEQCHASWASTGVSEGHVSPLTTSAAGSAGLATAGVTSPGEQPCTSWSSSDTPESPVTPLMASAQVSREPGIAGEQHRMAATNDDSGGFHGQEVVPKKTVEELLLSGPPIPHPVPALLPSELAKATAFALENPTYTTNVYIRGLPANTDDDKLLEITSRFGKVTSHKAIMDIQEKVCKGYGFSRYERAEDARNCIRGLISLNYEAGFARESFNSRLKSLSDPTSTNLYVSNIPPGMDDKQMQTIFTPYFVVSTRLLRTIDGDSRGVGFARFTDRSTCDLIIKEFHGKLLKGQLSPLQVRYADTRAQKCLKLAAIRMRSDYNTTGNGYFCPILPPSCPLYTHGVWFGGRNRSLASPGISLPHAPQPSDPGNRGSAAEVTYPATHQSRSPQHGGSDPPEPNLNGTSAPAAIESTGYFGSFSEPGDRHGQGGMSPGNQSS